MLVRGDTQANETVLVLRYRQIDDFIGVVGSAAKERGCICAVSIPSPVLCFPGLEVLMKQRCQKEDRRRNKVSDIIQDSVHRG